MRKTATTTVPVHPLLAERWSPRGFDQAHELADDRLTALLEAARWAPSAANSNDPHVSQARESDAAVAGISADSRFDGESAGSVDFSDLRFASFPQVTIHDGESRGVKGQFGTLRLSAGYHPRCWAL